MTAQDVGDIRKLIARQFGSLNWDEKTAADWAAFTDDFIADAALYPAARPAKRQTVPAFVERMKGLASSSLKTFHERVLGTDIQVFGSVAIARAACEFTENGTQVSRGVEMMLLVKTEGEWRIVAQAWDRESEANPIPDDLLRG